MTIDPDGEVLGLFARGRGGRDEMNIRALSSLITELRRHNPQDIRDKGWTVAVHNDYRLNNQTYTFWLFTRGHFSAKGEGKTDGDALDIVRQEIDHIEKEYYDPARHTPTEP